MKDIALHNPVNHPFIKGQQGIRRAFVEIFQSVDGDHRQSIVAEHPCLAFQRDSISDLIRRHFSYERDVITSSAADLIENISRSGSRNYTAQRIRGIGIFGSLEMNHI